MMKVSITSLAVALLTINRLDCCFQNSGDLNTDHVRYLDDSNSFGLRMRWFLKVI